MRKINSLTLTDAERAVYSKVKITFLCVDGAVCVVHLAISGPLT